MSLITILIPAYNEEKNVPYLASELLKTIDKMKYQVEVIFINDGSSDSTEQVLKELSSRSDNIFYINFSRNFGQQNALRAGYDCANGDAVICMDADLQNPPYLIPELIASWERGYDVVVCKRIRGKQNTGFFKEITSRLFYKILMTISDNEIERDTPDFRLVDRKLVEIIKRLPENDIFLRGIITWMGFKRDVIEYEHGIRRNGETKYSFARMIKLAESGLTSFSVRPLHIAIYLGMFFSCLSLLYIPYVFIRYFNGHTISGWSSLIVIVTFLGGLQLLILGVIGLYLGKLFIQTKHRPDYIIKDTNVVTKI